ncbi:MAG TPA: hypothetical protein VK508_16200 [Cyclobacteriaceae bacterium]|nr:hypothetical protein [Cyclobacteriaceae bacterium]
MLRNYFIVAFRNLRRSLLHSTIILMSLGIGIASCLVIYVFINDELSFDGFHTKKANIYRLNERQRMGDGTFQELALTIGVLTISYHTMKTARANPVDSLKQD